MEHHKVWGGARWTAYDTADRRSFHTLTLIVGILMVLSTGAAMTQAASPMTVTNGQFDQWSGPRPAGWSFHANRAEIRPTLKRVQDDDGRTWASLGALPSGLSTGWLTQTLSIPAKAQGWVRFSCKVRLTSGQMAGPNVLIVLKWARTPNTGWAGRHEYVYLTKTSTQGIYEARHVFQVVPHSRELTLMLGQRGGTTGTVAFADVELTPCDPPAPRHVKVATAYWVPPRKSDWRQNLAGIEQLSAQAAQQNCDLILFGEGVSVIRTGRSYVQAAEPIPGPVTDALAAVARRHHIFLAAGVFERDGQAVYNTAVLFDRDGRLVGKYRKVHLSLKEVRDGIQPGNHFPVFDTELGRIGMMICYDHQFPEAARSLALQGARIILVPIWGDVRGNKTQYDLIARARAIDNGVFYVTSNYSNRRSLIVGPMGRILAQTDAAADDAPALAVADLDLNRLRHADLPIKPQAVFPLNYPLERRPAANSVLSQVDTMMR